MSVSADSVTDLLDETSRDVAGTETGLMSPHPQDLGSEPMKLTIPQSRCLYSARCEPDLSAYSTRTISALVNLDLLMLREDGRWRPTIKGALTLIEDKRDATGRYEITTLTAGAGEWCHHCTTELTITPNFTVPNHTRVAREEETVRRGMKRVHCYGSGSQLSTGVFV